MQVSGSGYSPSQRAQARAAGRALHHEQGAVVQLGDVAVVRVPGQDDRGQSVERRCLLRVVHEGHVRRLVQRLDEVRQALAGPREHLGAGVVVTGALVGREPGVPRADDGEPGDLDLRVVEDGDVRQGGHPVRRHDGVVVAADEDVGHVQRADGGDRPVLRRAAPVDDVAGVEHAVHLELARHLAHQVEAGRVEVDVGDVQQRDGVVVGAGRRQRGQRAVQRADVRDEVGQGGAVGVEPGDEVLGAADEAVRVDQQAGVRGRGQRLRPPGADPDAADAQQQGAGQARGDQRARADAAAPPRRPGRRRRSPRAR